MGLAIFEGRLYRATQTGFISVFINFITAGSDIVAKIPLESPVRASESEVFILQCAILWQTRVGQY